MTPKQTENELFKYEYSYALGREDTEEDNQC
jgi:hypothetical protein